MQTEKSLPLTRRQFLGRTALGLAATIGTSVLAACSQAPAPAATSAPAKPAESKPAAPTSAPAKPAAVQPTSAPIPTQAVVQPTAAPTQAAAATQAPAAAQAKQGGTLTVSQSVDINSLHPWISTLNVWKVVKTNIYDQLSYQDAETFQFKPKLAKSFEWADNNTSLVVTLPSGVTFHNGEKLTAADVKFTLDSILDPQVGSWLRGFISAIKEVQLVDDTHLKLKTDGVQNQLIPAFTYVDIVPRSMGTDLAKKNPIGSGPFKFTEWVPNDRVVVEKNASYWDQSRMAKVDKIVFKPVTEMQTRLSQVLAGNVDLVYDFALQEVPRLQADKRVNVVLNPPAEQSFSMYLNQRKPPFDKVEMRQAIGWSLDREAFFKNFQAGIGSPVGNSPFTDKHWAYEPKTAAAYKYDPDKVGQLMEKAGYPKGKGLEFTLLVPNGYPEFKQVSTLIQATFAQLGYQPQIEEVEIAQWSARLNQSHDFNAAADYPGRGTADPALTYSAGLMYPPNPANVGGLTPETMPGYVDQLKIGASSTDQATRKEAYSKVQMLWVEYLPGAIFGHRSAAHALTPAVKGFIPHAAFQQDWTAVSLEK
ncbi:MAG: ABC transporter substrate-binding protein [Chloroflexi bacterium]|nr:ABC transporter substrate-binding protein [Chloroflexota bacterium]